MHSAYMKEKRATTNEPKLSLAHSDHQEEDSGKIISSPILPGEVKDDPGIQHEYPPDARTSEADGFKWTKTHGFFLQMGGFVLHEKGKQRRILGWEPLMEHYKAGRINLSTITEARINDHSKADGFAKGVALLQTIWFIIQCVARFSSNKNLVLTELEIVTAALATLSLVMYFLWWNKPFNAEIPIIVTLSLPKSDSSTKIYPQEPHKDIRSKVAFMFLEDCLTTNPKEDPNAWLHSCISAGGLCK